MGRCKHKNCAVTTISNYSQVFTRVDGYTEKQGEETGTIRQYQVWCDDCALMRNYNEDNVPRWVIRMAFDLENLIPKGKQSCIHCEGSGKMGWLLKGGPYKCVGCDGEGFVISQMEENEYSEKVMDFRCSNWG